VAVFHTSGATAGLCGMFTCILISEGTSPLCTQKKAPADMGTGSIIRWLGIRASSLLFSSLFEADLANKLSQYHQKQKCS
jgi:hypothetical protein